MYPYILIVLLQADIIPFIAVAIHCSEITDFDVRSIFNAYAPTIGHSILAYALESDIRSCIVIVFDHNVASQGVSRVGNLPHQPNDQRTCVFSFFKSIQYGLQADAGVCVGACHCKRNCVFCLFGNIDYHSIFLWSSIGFVCPRHPSVGKSKAGTIVCTNSECRCFSAFTFHTSRHSRYFKCISSGFKSHYIGTKIRTIVTDQLRVNLFVRHPFATVIYIVAVGACHGLPFHKSRLEPTAG